VSQIHATTRGQGTRRNLVEHYVCDCLPGYTGNKCQTNIDDCNPNPCRNHARCEDHVNNYTCQCLPGYTGYQCEVDIDECQSNPCQYSGTCKDNVNSYHCDCVQGFEGDRCGIQIDECASFPCRNGGRCLDHINQFSCACNPGYKGKLCGIEILECESNPCQNRGVCREKVNGYTCTCDPGYGGNECQISKKCMNRIVYKHLQNSCFLTDVDECQSNPCRNNATCHDDINGYKRVCDSKYSGTNCEKAFLVSQEPVTDADCLSTSIVAIIAGTSSNSAYVHYSSNIISF
jgi:Notch-like protein